MISRQLGTFVLRIRFLGSDLCGLSGQKWWSVGPVAPLTCPNWKKNPPKMEKNRRNHWSCKLVRVLEITGLEHIPEYLRGNWPPYQYPVYHFRERSRAQRAQFQRPGALWERCSTMPLHLRSTQWLRLNGCSTSRGARLLPPCPQYPHHTPNLPEVLDV